MLYTKEALRNQSQEESITAIQRYFHKIHKGETSKLLPHECEYLSIRLRSIFQIGGNERVLEPYQQTFLWEAVFKHLILVYLDNLDFLLPAFDGVKYLTAEEVVVDKAKFYELKNKWLNRLQNEKGDRILHEVKLEYHRKLKLVEQRYKNGEYGWFRFKRKCLEQELNSFYIYFAVKTYFRNLKADYIEFAGFGERFVVGVFSYIHILSRHYIPKLNGVDSEKSFNDELPFIAPFDLPKSIAQLIDAYFQNAPAAYNLNPEFMIFAYKGSHYIIWWKHKLIEEIGKQYGFEIRTLYKIERPVDLSKITHDKNLDMGNSLIFQY